MRYGTRNGIIAAARKLRPGIPAAGPSFEEDVARAVDHVIRGDGWRSCVKLRPMRLLNKIRSTDPKWCGIFGVHLPAAFSAGDFTSRVLGLLDLPYPDGLELDAHAVYGAIQEQAHANLADMKHAPGELLDQLRGMGALRRAILARGGAPSDLEVISSLSKWASDDPDRFWLIFSVAAQRLVPPAGLEPAGSRFEGGRPSSRSAGA